MSEAVSEASALDVSSELRAVHSHLARRMLRNPFGLLALAILAIIVLGAVFAPLLTSYNPGAASVTNVLLPPGHGHLLGTDGAGRDVWARLLYGARYTLAGALLATVVAAIIGITAGLVAGYYGKWFESTSSWITNVLMALPGIVVLLAAVQSTRDERRYESAMLRTLGASRGTVLQGVAAEFSALGFLSGTLAAFGATGIGWVLARRLFSLQYTLDPWVWVVGLVCGTVLVGLSGTLATRRVVNTPPIHSLRDE